MTPSDGYPIIIAKIPVLLTQRSQTEKGVYNFLCTTKFGGREVYILVQPESKNSVLQNVVIDLNGSDLFFSQPYNEAVTINDCQNLTLENFSIDYTTLPFTQLLVQSIVN